MIAILKNVGQRPWWIAGGALFLAWAIWFFRADESIQKDPNPILPFQVERDLELASGSQPLDGGSLRLICTATRELRLLLQATLPKRELLHISDSDAATLFIDRRIDEELLFEQADLVAMGKIDTVVTEPLSEEQVSKLVRLTNKEGVKRFSFMAFERSVFLLGSTNGAAIEGFAHDCSAQPQG